jgi:hypothetical protein
MIRRARRGDIVTDRHTQSARDRLAVADDAMQRWFSGGLLLRRTGRRV